MRGLAPSSITACRNFRNRALLILMVVTSSPFAEPSKISISNYVGLALIGLVVNRQIRGLCLIPFSRIKQESLAFPRYLCAPPACARRFADEQDDHHDDHIYPQS